MCVRFSGDATFPQCFNDSAVHKIASIVRYIKEYRSLLMEKLNDNSIISEIWGVIVRFKSVQCC